MSDYISREAALRDWPLCDEPGDAYQFIRHFHAADVRPVVLCRDCKHRFMTPNGWHCPYAEWGIEDDDFCSCGEKREES